MRFYVNDQEVEVVNGTSIRETLDETLDTCTITLALSDDPTPFEPKSRARMEEGGESLHFVVQGDVVEIATLNPMRWRHTVTLIQNTARLKDLIVRNSSFQQPSQSPRKAVASVCELLDPIPSNGKLQFAQNPMSRSASALRITVPSRERIERCELLIDVQVALADTREFSTASQPCLSDSCRPSSMEDLNSRIDRDMNSLFISSLYAYWDGGSQLLTAEYYEGPLEINRPIRMTDAFCELIRGKGNVFVAPSIGEYGIYGKPIDFIAGGKYHIVPSASSASAIFASFRLSAYTYYYTLYDILVELRARQALMLYRDYAFELPEVGGETREILQSTIAPNLTFTQCTMHDCVAEVFRCVDSTFGMDGEGHLYMERLNIEGAEPVSPSLTGARISLSGENCTDFMTCFYQDARVAVQFPQGNGWMRPKSKELGVPGDDDHSIVVPLPMHDLKSLKSKVDSSFPIRFGDGFKLIAVRGLEVDITPYVFEKSVWSLLDQGDVAIGKGSKLNGRITQKIALSYSSGGSSISVGERTKSLSFETRTIGFILDGAISDIGGYPYYDGSQTLFEDLYPSLSSSDFSSWNDYLFRAEYEATVSGRAEALSFDRKAYGSTTISQSSGAVSLERLGLNLYGTSCRTGEPALSATHSIGSWSQRIRKGQEIEFAGQRYVANLCAYEITNAGVVGKIEFARNFNGLSKRVRLDRDKRFSEISPSVVQKSEEVLRMYLRIDQGDGAMSVPSQYSRLADELLGPLAGSRKGIRSAAIQADGGNYFEVPMWRYASGNVVSFEMAYDSPMEAGRYTLDERDGWFGTSSYFTYSARYANADGFLDSATLGLLYEGSGDSEEYPRIAYPSDSDVAASFYLAYLRKQPNECFALNIEACLVPGDGCFVGNAYARIAASDGALPRLRLFVGGGQYKPTDLRARGQDMGIASVSRSQDGSLEIAGVPQCDSFALADEGGRIVFASNKGADGGDVRLYASLGFDRI